MKEKVLKIIALMFFDLVILVFSSIFALWCRFDFIASSIPLNYLSTVSLLMPFHCLMSIAVYYVAGLYSFDLHSISFFEVFTTAVAVSIGNVATVLLSLVAGERLPFTVYFITYVLEAFLTVFLRCSRRMVISFTHVAKSSGMELEKVMVVGGGGACDMFLRETEMDPKINISVKCIVDDNKSKLGTKIRGVKISGNRFDIPRLCKEYEIEKIIFAIPTLSGKERRKILDICEGTGVKVMTLPGIYDLMDKGNEVSATSLRDINITDLLGREQVVLDDTMVGKFIKNKTVLITGGGGSIGSEICRQVAERDPKRIVIIDIYENNAYDIQQELKRKYGDTLDLVVEIASVRDKKKIYELFEKHHPDIVFHAAAHKHVPLMEYCPSEAIKNNIFGTFHVVRASEKFGVSKFILISTDKAVNPTNIMGATKRFCEMIIQSRGESATEYATVRFGNVLGSNGSVVPLFTKQIEAGGPVTITDKRVIRYFMTIPEASQLVLQAGAMAKKNQVFVLDMGEPVRILDLAEKMIRLAGKKPYTEVKITETGLRPGEKLYEELLMKNERLEKTAHSDIYIEKQEDIDTDKIFAGLKSLDQMVSDRAGYKELSDKLKELVPTYRDPDSVNKKAVSMACETDSEDDVLKNYAKDCLSRIC